MLHTIGKPYIDKNWRKEKKPINWEDEEWYRKADKEKLPAQIVISRLYKRASRIDLYRELIRDGAIYDIQLIKNGSEKRCFVTFDRKSDARYAVQTIMMKSSKNEGVLSGTVVNWAYRDAHGEKLYEGSNVQLAMKVRSNNRKRNKIIIEGVDTSGSKWEGRLIDTLRHERLIDDKHLEDQEIRECIKLDEGYVMIRTMDEYLADRLYLNRPESREAKIIIKRRFNVILSKEIKDDRTWKKLKEEEATWKKDRRKWRDEKKGI